MVRQTSEIRFIIETVHENIRTMSCLDKIMDNLDHIPIEVLEKLVDKYCVV